MRLPPAHSQTPLPKDSSQCHLLPNLENIYYGRVELRFSIPVNNIYLIEMLSLNFTS